MTVTPQPHPLTEDPLFLPPVSPGTSNVLVHGRPMRRYILWFSLLATAIAMVWGATGSILLPNHVQILEFQQWFTGADANADLSQLQVLADQVSSGAIVPTPEQQHQLELLAGFSGARAQALALVTTIGLIGTMITTPIVGILADRTRSRLGRRGPWILYGGIIGSLFLAAMAFAPTVAILAILWVTAQVVLNFLSGPLTTTLADRVVERKRGTVSSMSGLGAFVGGILGSVGAGLAFARIGVNLYLVMAAIVLVCAVAFVFLARDRSSADLPRRPLRAADFVLAFVAPLKDRDFRWVWVARIALTFGYSVSGALGFFMLQSYIKPGLSAAEATTLVPVLGLIGLPGTLIALVVAGRLSDKIGRRKPFVIAASILMAVSFTIPLISPTLPGLLIQGGIAGLAFGIYLPVDQALFVDVLPNLDNAGRDLGVASIGNNLGQALGPVLAAQIVVITGGYGGVWVAGAVLVILAAFLVLPVKRVR